MYQVFPSKQWLFLNQTRVSNNEIKGSILRLSLTLLLGNIFKNSNSHCSIKFMLLHFLKHCLCSQTSVSSRISTPVYGKSCQSFGSNTKWWILKRVQKCSSNQNSKISMSAECALNTISINFISKSFTYMMICWDLVIHQCEFDVINDM